MIHVRTFSGGGSRDAVVPCLDDSLGRVHSLEQGRTEPTRLKAVAGVRVNEIVAIELAERHEQVRPAGIDTVTFLAGGDGEAEPCEFGDRLNGPSAEEQVLVNSGHELLKALEERCYRPGDRVLGFHTCDRAYLFRNRQCHALGRQRRQGLDARCEALLLDSPPRCRVPRQLRDVFVVGRGRASLLRAFALE